MGTLTRVAMAGLALASEQSHNSHLAEGKGWIQVLLMPSQPGLSPRLPPGPCGALSSPLSQCPTGFQPVTQAAGKGK